MTVVTAVTEVGSDSRNGSNCSDGSDEEDPYSALFICHKDRENLHGF